MRKEVFAMRVAIHDERIAIFFAVAIPVNLAEIIARACRASGPGRSLPRFHPRLVDGAVAPSRPLPGPPEVFLRPSEDLALIERWEVAGAAHVPLAVKQPGKSRASR